MLFRSLEALVRILFLIGRDSKKIDKRRVEQLIQQGPVPVEHYIDPIVLRETIRLQNLLVFVHPEESLRSLPLLLPETEARQQILAAVALLVPELLTTIGAEGKLWCELHSLLDIPLPGPSLAPQPSEADAVKLVAPPVATQPAPTLATTDASPARKPGRGVTKRTKPE